MSIRDSNAGYLLVKGKNRNILNWLNTRLEFLASAPAEEHSSFSSMEELGNLERKMVSGRR